MFMTIVAGPSRTDTQRLQSHISPAINTGVTESSAVKRAESLWQISIFCAHHEGHKLSLSLSLPLPHPWQHIRRRERAFCRVFLHCSNAAK